MIRSYFAHQSLLFFISAFDSFTRKVTNATFAKVKRKKTFLRILPNVSVKKYTLYSYKYLTYYFHLQYYKTKKRGIPPNVENSSKRPEMKIGSAAKFGSMPNLSSGYTEAILASTTNTASHLRSTYNREKRKTYEKQELLEKRKQLENEMRQIEMRENHPAWQRLRFEVVDHSEIEAKKSQRSLEAKERSREYKLELEKMMTRVQNQPTLFERQSAVNYCTVLKLPRYIVPTALIFPDCIFVWGANFFFFESYS